jgi:hypothetical protein
VTQTTSHIPFIKLALGLHHFNIAYVAGNEAFPDAFRFGTLDLIVGWGHILEKMARLVLHCLENIEKRGFRLATISTFLQHIREMNNEPPQSGRIIDGAWNMAKSQEARM